jgi:hypothetical protein
LIVKKQERKTYWRYSMNTFGFDPWTDYKLRQQDRLREVEHDRLVKEALKARQPQDHTSSAVLALIGRKLTNMGASLEERYGDPSEIESRFIRQSETGDC